MVRICLCLLIAAASASVAARESRGGEVGAGGACPQSIAERKPAAVRDNTTPVRQVRESKLKPTVHGDAPGGSRLQPQRWHSLLPGMFR